MYEVKTVMNMILQNKQSVLKLLFLESVSIWTSFFGWLDNIMFEFY